MKKYYLVLTMCLFLMSSYAQSNEEQDPYFYETIIDVPNTSKDEIYIRANQWFVDNFRSAEDAIDFQDKEAGKILGKFTFSRMTLYDFRIQQTIDISIKDNKARVRFYDVIVRTYYQGKETGRPKPIKKDKDIEALKENRIEIIEGLTSTLNSDSDDW